MQRDLGEVPEVSRGEPMRLNEWQSFLDDVGRVTDVKKLKDRIFHGVCVRKEKLKIYDHTDNSKTTLHTNMLAAKLYEIFKRKMILNTLLPYGNCIFQGIDELIRKTVWQYLLGYKKYGYTAQSQQTLFIGKE